MNTDSLVASLEVFSARLFKVAASNETKVVGSCPGWELKDLVAHIGVVFGAVTGVIK